MALFAARSEGGDGAGAPSTRSLAVTVLHESGPVTLDRLVSALADAPAIVYLVAHGVLAADGPYLMLQDDNGKVKRIAGDELVARMQEIGLASAYQLLRSESPYPKPGNGSVSLPLANPSLTTQSDAGAMSGVNAYFYVVKAFDGTPAASADSNRICKLTFQLTKGG